MLLRRGYAAGTQKEKVCKTDECVSKLYGGLLKMRRALQNR